MIGLEYEFKPISTILEVRPEQYSLEDVQHHLLSYKSKIEEETSAINFEQSHKAAHLASENVNVDPAMSRVQVGTQVGNQSSDVCD